MENPGSVSLRPLKWAVPQVAVTGVADSQLTEHFWNSARLSRWRSATRHSASATAILNTLLARSTARVV